MREARRLAMYVQPALSEPRLARQWSDIVRASERAVPPRKLLYAFAVAVVLVPVLVLASRRMRAPLPAQDAAAVAAIESGSVTLADGSRITVENGGRVRVASGHARDIELVLEAGAVALEVPHTNRRMTVHAGRYDVTDLGTRFRVALGAAGQVGVHVEEGTVEVRARGASEPPRALSAGDEWSNAPPAAARAEASARSDTAPSPAAIAVESLPSIPPEAGAPSAPSPAEAAMSAKDLLELAERQRLGGNLRAAASALDTLRRRHRNDPRAALAAFELGRIRLDGLGDAHGAVEAFNDSIALSPNGPLREDAEARRVEALDIEHSGDCPSARDAFLARYPRGVHRAVVAARCGGP
jgi:transmembrane sensor